MFKTDFEKGMSERDESTDALMKGFDNRGPVNPQCQCDDRNEPGHGCVIR